jgi:fibronectin-binding autotransporter adhesin
VTSASNVPDFAVAGAGVNLVAPTYVTQNNLSLWTDDNILVSGTTSLSVAANSTINSLRFTSAQAVTLAGQLTVRSGMIVFPGLLASAGMTISGGSLTTGNGQDLIFFDNYNNSNQTRKTISSTITGGNALTYSGSNGSFGHGGYLALNNASNVIGDIYVSAGVLESLQSGSLGATATARTLYLLGGSISFEAGTTQSYTNTALTVGATGGQWTDSSVAASFSTTTSSFGGAVTLNGNLFVGALSDQRSGRGAKTLTGDISGPGSLRLTSTSRMTLSGNNSAWTGGMTISGGAQVRLDSANAAGTLPIFNGDAVTGIGIVEFTNNFGNSLTNDLLVSAAGVSTLGSGFLISNAKTNAAVTLSGKIASNGLTFQGVDTTGGPPGSGVSETVLSGKVATSGTPINSSYGNTTTIQNFINGQSGINLGVTAFAASSVTALAYGTSGFLAYNAGTTTGVTDGAEGYVRFSGTNSFLPGAVGPGYVAALRKGGASTLNFGYFLTGSGSGTTYTLPEGKSFVIGTLGSGTGQTGTFGAAGTGTNTATFLGNPKAAAGQLLAGFNGGDINIHANAATGAEGTATLNLSARNAGDTLVLGDGVTAANNVVITPTWGDSGASSAVTLLQKRTGGTTLNKIGLGTLEIKGVNFTNTDGTDARAGFTWNVNAGMLKYSQVDSGANYAAVNVSGGFIGGTGTVNGAVTVSSTGGIDLRDGAVGTLTLGSGSTLGITGAAGANNLYFDLGNNTGTSDQISVAGTTTVTTAGSAVVNLNQLNGLAGRNETTYTLIGGAGTLDATNFAKFTLATTAAFGQTYALANGGTNGDLQVTATNVTSVTPAAFWAGSTDGNWSSSTNWRTTLADNLAVAGAPDYQTNVTFATTTPGPLLLTTNVLDVDFDINSLNFNDAAGGVTIGGTKMLTIEATNANSNAAGNGINSANTSGTNTISAKVGLAASQTWTVATGGTLAVSGVVGDFGGGYGITKAGSGTLTLSGANSYTGLTTVSAGTLEVTVNDALGTNAAGTTVANGATLKLTGVNYATTEALSINGTGVGGGGALLNSGTSTFAGLITALTNATINAGGGVLNLTGGLVKDGTTLTFTGGGSINISSVISGASANSDLAVDATTVTLTAANTYNGPTTITNGGTLIANALGALPLSPRSAVSFTGTGTSALNLGANQFVASLTSAGAATVALGSNTLTVGITGGNTTFAGSIGGAGNLIKDTNSKQVLSGSNGYTGTTMVSAGTLEVTGSLSGTTAVTVSTGGTLLMNGGSNNVGTGDRAPVASSQTISGTVAGANFTGSGGTLAVAQGAGGNGTTHSFNQMTLTANSTLDFSSGAGTTNTNVNLIFASLNSATKTALFNGTTTLTINGWGNTSYASQLGTGPYTLGTSSNPGAVDGGSFGDGQDRLIFTTDPGFGLGNFIAGINFTGFGAGATQVAFGSGFEIVPVPEPATTALIGSIALCALVGYRERRRFTGLGKRTAARK